MSQATIHVAHWALFFSIFSFFYYYEILYINYGMFIVLYLISLTHYQSNQLGEVNVIETWVRILDYLYCAYYELIKNIVG